MRAIDCEMTDSADRNKAERTTRGCVCSGARYPREEMRIVQEGLNKEDLLAAQ